MADLNTQIPIPGSNLVQPGSNVPNKEWYNFFTALFLRTGGPTNDANVLLDTLGSVRGGMLSRFATGWAEFEATIANTMPVMNPGGLTDVQLKTISQLLDFINGTQGSVLYRGAAGWQVLAPVASKFLMSQGAGADPAYSDVPMTPLANTVDTGLTATGATQATALVLTKQWNLVSTTAAGTGVMLPDSGAGFETAVYNDGANALLVYPPVGKSINALAVDAGYSLPAARNQFLQQVTANLWRTSILG